MRVSRGALVAYGLPVLGAGFMWNMIGVYFLKFSTDVLLLGPATIGLILGVARVWDAISDPLAGFWSDRTRTRLGRRRPWLFASAIPLGLLFVAVWSPPRSLDGGALVAWMVVAVLLFYTALTAFRIPHASLGAELGGPDDRTRLFTSAAIFESIGALIGLAAVGQLIAQPEAQRATLTPVVVGIAVVGATGVMLSAALLRERREYWGRGASRPFGAFRDVIQNPHARRLLTVDFLHAMGLVCAMTAVPYACEYHLGNLEWMTLMLLAFVVPHLVVLPLWPPLSRRWGKRDVWFWARGLEAVAFAAIFFVPAANAPLVALLVAIAGAADGSSVLGRPLMADAIDFDEARTGERKEGTYFAASGLVAKLAVGAATALVGGALALAGFRPNVAQSSTSLLAIRSLLSFGPLLFISGGLIVLAGLKIGGPAPLAPREREPAQRGGLRRGERITTLGNSVILDR